MTFPEHILSTRPWARRWGARQGPCRTQAGAQRGTTCSAPGPWTSEAGVTPVLVKVGQGWGAGIPQLGEEVTGVWEPKTLN